MRDLAEFLEHIGRRGFTHHFSVTNGTIRDPAQQFRAEQVRLIDTETIDNGTDPGDDVTVYLIETETGTKGYLVVSVGSHADPGIAAFVDLLGDP